MTEKITERPTGLRIMESSNYSCYNEQNMITDTRALTSLIDVAEMLDLTGEADITRRGASGRGAGAVLEVVFDNEDTDSESTAGEQIWSVDDPVLDGVPLGDNCRELRSFIRRQESSTIWDGHNRVVCPTHHIRNILNRIRAR